MNNQTDHYEDDAELTAYVRHNYRHLLTDMESLAARAIIAEQKANASSERMAKVLRERWGGQNDPRVIEALKDGPDMFHKRVRRRILEVSADNVFINRCPSCQHIVATPKARQCLRCGYDWHKRGGDETEVTGTKQSLVVPSGSAFLNLHLRNERSFVSRAW